MKLNDISTAEIYASAEALQKLNDATSKGFGERLFDTVDMVVGRLLPEETPSVNVTSVSPGQVLVTILYHHAGHGMGGSYDERDARHNLRKLQKEY